MLLAVATILQSYAESTVAKWLPAVSGSHQLQQCKKGWLLASNRLVANARSGCCTHSDS